MITAYICSAFFLLLSTSNPQFKNAILQFQLCWLGFIARPPSSGSGLVHHRLVGQLPVPVHRHLRLRHIIYSRHLPAPTRLRLSSSSSLLLNCMNCLDCMTCASVCELFTVLVVLWTLRTFYCISCHFLYCISCPSLLFIVPIVQLSCCIIV